MDQRWMRRLAIGLLALLPLLVLSWASLRFAPDQTIDFGLAGGDTQLMARVAALPGSPAGEPPATALVPLAAGDAARARNAAIPFLPGPLRPAPAYRFAGSPDDFRNARDCLALAAMAEAGPSDPGQRAVIQVVLNRVRHPAFVSSVCGVVFEGAERASGCQFTFTCDGSLARRYGPGSWEAARSRAEQALKGQVFAAVGNATHYHTDWVFPWWTPLLHKIAQVDTHLFLRWPGYWGSVQAWRRHYGGREPALAELLARARAATGIAAEDSVAATDAIARPPLPADTPRISGGSVVMRLPSGKANFVTVEPAAGSDSALAIARKLCPAEGTCRVLGWAERGQIPAALPLPPAARASLQFSYARDPGGSEIALFNCDSFPGLPREQCIPRAR